MFPLPCTAIVTAFRRIELTLVTLKKIQSCEPRPDEIIAHVDGNQTQCETAIRSAFPDVKVFRTETCVGPGGGRNKLINAARNEIVASFDDDSYPIDADYFARVMTLFERFPAASVLCAAVYHQGEAIAPDSRAAEWTSDFIGCGCVYRRTAFLGTGGYVPLPVAYGMEEVDVALQLHALGHRVLKAFCLRVFHDTDYSGHVSSKLVSGTIANAALLTYLRYPPGCWPRGALQVLNAAWYAFRKRRYRGILAGLLMIPRHLYHHRQYRGTVSSTAVRSYLALRRNPQLLG